MALAAEYQIEHYPSPAEKWADWWVHAVGLVAAAIGGAILVALAVASGRAGLATATGLYALTLVGMLACSAAYNLTRPSRVRPFLRRLDEAAIFLMIAGCYTPFTTQRFTGGWAIGMTALVWTMAACGVTAKLLVRKLPDWLWTAFYVAFGWVALIAIRPMLMDVPVRALILLIAGGLLYTTGTLVFHSRLPFRRAIWHGFVVVGAAIHYAAICTGVVLAAHG
ncbi:MAG TPA: hemolysin III family protein [Caulobacteraceae bacterium]|jgi:hemolysin III|nr:hemolysin III family protein [Caulobacteraceae bacterium]